MISPKQFCTYGKYDNFLLTFTVKSLLILNL